MLNRMRKKMSNEVDKKSEFRTWVSWSLQCLSYIGGLLLVVKQFIPVKHEAPPPPAPDVGGMIKSLPMPFPFPLEVEKVQPDIVIITIIILVLIGITVGASYWRNR